jgi:hypothetical protein
MFGLRVGKLGGAAGKSLPAGFPLASAAPVISGANAVGSVLTCTPGTWTGTPAPTVTRQWRADGVNISGATGLTYTTVAGNLGKLITCTETATNTVGTGSASSNSIPVGVTVANTVAPVISGTAVVGQTLSCTTGTWTGSPAPTYTYQWKAEGVAIPGATANTFVVAAQNVNYTCTVTGSNVVGSAAATSNSILSLTAPVNSVAPTVTGDATVGNVLTSTNGAWIGSATITFTYQWQANGVNIAGATANTYASSSGDIGKSVTCRVTGTNAAGNSFANSNALTITAAVIAPPANTVLPAVTGNATVGSLLTCIQGTWTGQAPITYVYQWKADTINIVGATSQTYTTVTGDIGKTITCRVTATNVGGVTIATSNGIVVTAVVWTPANLFAAGEQGVWYDPSDFSTMFQDSAGTTPVTAVGQTVGKILDKSGRNNHATQATAAAHPVLQIDGNGKYYLGFDGVDDSLATAAINFTATDKMSVFCGVTKTSGNGYQTLCELGTGSVENGFAIFAPNNNNNNYDFRLYATIGETASTYAPPRTDVLSVNYDTTAGTPQTERNPRINGAGVTLTTATAAGAGNFINGALNIGRRNNESLPLNGRIYSLIVRGALSTTQEITDTETWVNGKTQAY